MTDNAIQFLRQHDAEAPRQPFFCFVSYTAPHWPLHALPDDIAKYKGHYSQGYDATRRTRIERMRQMGLIDSNWQPAPTVGRWDDPTVGHWEDIKDRDWEERCMEVYAAQVDRLDQGVGRIIAELERMGRLDNTVVFFLQDNGACAETMWRKPYLLPREPRPMAPDELQRLLSPPLMQTRGGVAVRSGQGVMPGPAESFVVYGVSWANVSNTPFRKYKHWVHEGGISTPLIVHWPRGIPAARDGQFVRDPAHIIDIMATCVDLAGATYPPPAAPGDQRPAPTALAGVSLRPTFDGKPLARSEPLFWEHEGTRALREGRWKLVAQGPAEPWELYDMVADRTEQRDLAAAQPQRVHTLATQWEAWARSHHVLPWVWEPHYGATIGSKTR